jgi:hypothetical protein
MSIADNGRGTGRHIQFQGLELLYGELRVADIEVLGAVKADLTTGKHAQRLEIKWTDKAYIIQ